MYSYSWYHWLTFFYVYCVIGWIFESCYVSLKQRHWINRGFLRLPMLPLYGSGAVIMLWVSLPFQNNPVMLYIAGVITTTALEYLTGYVMERLFRVRYWDYSNQKFNLHGYICLSSSIAWGFFTLLMVHVIHHPIAKIVLSLPLMLEVILLIVVSSLFIYDVIISTKTALDLGQVLEAMTSIHAELDHIQVQLSLLKAEANQKMDSLKTEAAHKFTELKEENEANLAEKIQSLSEKYGHLTDHINPRLKRMRKRMLLGNPTATSTRFAKALKELKESLKELRE